MVLSPGARLGPYEILGPLGAGGMGEVYKARDTRLERLVAIKVLPAGVSSEPDLKERFEREARAVSSLNHPNICTLHDVGHQEGTDYLVMELIEGETLAARLEKGALPADQVLRVAGEIASALDRAHRSGIVHRDLKPGNIMLAKSGAKLLDFGLVKIRQRANPAAALSDLPTEGKALTGEGTILGTFQYMAPEQIEGKEADARTDIFAFGAVLYEMLTGRRAFSGGSQASLIASILASEPPPISTLRPMTPPALDRLVRTCLAKDPDDRWQTAHDLMLQIRWIAEGESQAGNAAPVATRRRSRETIAWAAAAALLLTTLAMSAAWLRHSPATAETIRLQMLPPEGTTFNSLLGPATLSPDGRLVAFVATDKDRGRSIWVRALGDLEARRLGETHASVYDPCWSPDSRFVAFGTEQGLMKADVSGGPVTKIADMEDGRGCTWSADNLILLTRTGTGPILRVPAAGGTPEPVTSLDEARHETGHWRPRFLPDGKHFIFLAHSAEQQEDALYVASLDSKERTRLGDIAVAAAPAPPGYLLYVRDRILLAQPFDMAALRLVADPVPIAKDVEYVPTWGTSGFSASDNGVLTYQGASRANRDLIWFDRSGNRIGALGETTEYADDPRLSPDGRFAAVARLDPETRGADIWILDVARGVASRLTSDPGIDRHPVWSPDGGRLAFMSTRSGTPGLYVIPVNGAAKEEILLTCGRWCSPTDWSPDGRLLLYATYDAKSRTDLWLLPLDGERTPRPVINSEFDELGGRFSPDGRWIAYDSDETGRREVFVQSFPPTGSKWQVSTAGGAGPRWRRDGREIVYLQPEASRMAVEIRTERGFEVGLPKKLFESPLSIGSDLAADGQRLLSIVPHGEAAASPVTIVLNWTAALRH